MRVYVPLILTQLRDVLASGAVGPAPVPAYAVTPAMREEQATGLPIDAGDDLEALEYAALQAAAAGALRLLAADPAAPRRRLVLVAEVPEGAVRPDPGAQPGEEPARVQVRAPIALAQVVAAQVDEPGVEPAVAAAAAALAAAETGDAASRDAAAQVAADLAEDHELLWYATQELGDLLP